MKHVLLIDDNEVDTYISKHIVTQSKVAQKITIKSSAMEALEYLETLKGNAVEFPDFILLDIRMPEMDGFGFLDQFIKFPEAINNKCTVAMLSSSGDKSDMDRALNYPVVKNYFIKPLSLDMVQSLE